MNVLIACEESQIECKCFRENGCRAFSCDLLECSGNKPEWHIREDATKLLGKNIKFKTEDGKEHIIDKWDLLIAHPPCTFITNAASYRFYRDNGERLEKGKKAVELFMRFYNADIKKICVENPIPFPGLNLPKYSQLINPYDFGEPYSKRTCLWLKGLPGLFSTEIVMERKSYVFSVKNNSERSKNRSKSFYGIAQAMAKQWTD